MQGHFYGQIRERVREDSGDTLIIIRNNDGEELEIRGPSDSKFGLLNLRLPIGTHIRIMVETDIDRSI